MSTTIQGIEFTGFPGRDFYDLQRLDFAGKVDWVEYRYRTFFLDTFTKLVASEADSYIWLCVVNLLTSAIDGFASFESRDRSGMVRFSLFVERYFSPDFSQPVHLDEPPLAHGRPAYSRAEHLYKYFRSGLAHSFCIEWGGLLHREDGASSYLFEATQGQHGERSLGVVPRELVSDFLQAVEKYFAALRRRQSTEKEFIAFTARFQKVYQNKVAPPA